MTKILPANHEVPLPKALPILQLPLPGGIVTADVSHCGNGGAGEVASGGVSGQSRTRAIKDASCRKDDDLGDGRRRSGLW